MVQPGIPDQQQHDGYGCAWIADHLGVLVSKLGGRVHPADDPRHQVLSLRRPARTPSHRRYSKLRFMRSDFSRVRRAGARSARGRGVPDLAEQSRGRGHDPGRQSRPPPRLVTRSARSSSTWRTSMSGRPARTTSSSALAGPQAGHGQGAPAERAALAGEPPERSRQAGNYLSAHATISEVDFGWADRVDGRNAAGLRRHGLLGVVGHQGAGRRFRSPPAAAGGSARGWALIAGVAAVFVAVFLVTILLFGRFDRASQGRTLTTMFARYGPRNEPAPGASAGQPGSRGHRRRRRHDPRDVLGDSRPPRPAPRPRRERSQAGRVGGAREPAWPSGSRPRSAWSPATSSSESSAGR